MQCPGKGKDFLMVKNETSPNPKNRIWMFFASVKLTVALLLTLAITSIIGTVIPQNETPAIYINAYGENLYRIFSFLKFFDMYRSWWFQLLIVFLTINVVVCSLERLPKTWKVVSMKKPPFNADRFRSDNGKVDFQSQRSVQTLRQTFEPFICKKFSYCRIEETDKGWLLFGEKGRWTRLGAYIVHMSIIFLLIGALIGSNYGFEGFVNIPEGETVNQIRLRNSNEIYPLDFDIRCDSFSVSFYETGTPKEYRSSLTILEAEQPVLQKDIIVNDPLSYKGINIFQSSYGAFPSDSLTLSISSREDEFGFNFIKETKIGEPVELPEGKGSVIIQDYTNSAQFGGRSIGEAFIGILTPPEGEPVQIILPLRFPNFDRMRQGDFIIGIQDYEKKFYTGLQVAYDPGVPVVYLGFIIMILGCFITFFKSHQRICVEIIQVGNNSRVMVAGSANKNKLGMQQKIKRISEKLQGMSQVNIPTTTNISRGQNE
jgi:cytochrome c biogenesis protein